MKFEVEGTIQLPDWHPSAGGWLVDIASTGTTLKKPRSIGRCTGEGFIVPDDPGRKILAIVYDSWGYQRFKWETEFEY